MNSKYKRIGLLDHMGWGNMGDAAVQESVIWNIRKRLPSVELIAFSLNPEDTQERHHLVSYPITWSPPRQAESATSGYCTPTLRARITASLKRCRPFYAVAKPIHDILRELAHLASSYRIVRSLDLLIISGGGQLSELWRGPWSHPYNVFKFCVLAKLARTPVFIIGVGAGPLKHPLSKFFARWSVCLADYKSFRDIESQLMVRNLGIRSTTYVYPDPAYALDMRDNFTMKPSHNSRPTIGLNPIGFCDPRIWPRHDGLAYVRYLDKLAAFSSWLLDQNYDVEVFTGEVSVDRYAMEDLRNRIAAHASKNGSAGITCVASLDLQKLLGQMSRFEFILTSKFHGVIFSHLLGKPVIALSYHRKIDDLMRNVGQSPYCLDISNFQVGELIKTFELLADNTEHLMAQSHRIVVTYSRAVHKQFDNLFANQMS